MAGHGGRGTWQQIQQSLSTVPYLMYDAIEDDQTRLEHLQWNGKVIPAADPFWQQYFPPNGWNCRCGVVQMSDNEVKQHGLVISRPKIKTSEWTNPRTGLVRQVSLSVDPGWDHNSGMNRGRTLEQMLLNRQTKM